MFEHLTRQQLEEYYLPRVLGEQFKSDYLYKPDLPFPVPRDVSIYKSLAARKLEDCKRVQKIIDAQYSHDSMKDMVDKRGQIFQMYSDPDHQVWAFNLMNDRAFTYINVHWVRDEDDLIANEFCRLTGLTKDQIGYIHTDDKSRYLSILHTRTDVDFLLHIHKKGKLEADFLTLLSGEMDLVVATHPLNPNYERHDIKMQDMMIISPKQYHTGYSKTEDVFFLSVQPNIPYDETMRIVKNHIGL